MSKSGMYNVKNAFTMIAVLLIALILSPIPLVQAAVLCSYSGPDVSNDLLGLSDFEVIGPEPLRAGDTLTVVFTLKSVEVPIQFGEHGVFVAARDPEGMNRDFGHVYQNDILDNGESINFKATITVDKEGEWIFWPSYYTKENSPYYYEGFGHDEWHACYLDVVSAARPDLIVEDIFWDPPHPRIDEQVTVGVVVKNIGDAPSRENDLHLWGCCDLTRRVDTLKSGETTEVYFEDPSLISIEPEEFEVIATVDAANELSESNEENNERTEFIIIDETIPILSVSIFTEPLPAGESNEISVRVTSDGAPVPHATVHLSATIGYLDPIGGVTDDNGEFISTFTAPTVTMTKTYTLYAEAEIGGVKGEGSVADLITVTPNIPPTAYIDIYPNPVGEGERVTFEGYGEDEDGEVVECRWTFPDGRIRSVSGSYAYFEDEDAQAGWYSFAVRDEDGAWSEEVGLELETPTTIPWIWLLAVIVLVIAAGAIEEVRKRRRKGSIYADSNPKNTLVFLDEVYSGLSPATVHEVPVGAHLVKFRKFGYFDCEREAMVNANQRTHVHCDLTEIPEIKLKLSAEPTEIPADGKSKSVITIRIEDKNGKLILVPEDVTVVLETNIGTVEERVKIPAGPALVTANLTSSTSSGTATVKAKAEFLKGSTTVEFLHST